MGAPAGAYFPEVAKRLGAELHIPPFFEVANAVGTVSGQTVEQVEILVKPDGAGAISFMPPGGGKPVRTWRKPSAKRCRGGKNTPLRRRRRREPGI